MPQTPRTNLGSNTLKLTRSKVCSNTPAGTCKTANFLSTSWVAVTRSNVPNPLERRIPGSYSN
jgi:hypothetical protein